jgi:aspartate kinase
MNPNVLKFGGSSFRGLKDYRSVAELLIPRLRSASDRLVVVVSAMYSHTDQLLDAARSLSPQLSAEASDAFVTLGECMSASLLQIALQARGVLASAVNGYRLGILSDSDFTHAAIRGVDAGPLRQTLEDSQVAVVTGAQAIDERGRITMTGRNSSDLTAVALAAALDSQECEIYSDVPGVYSADPYIFPQAKLLPELSHCQLIEMSRSGAKVIHLGAAEYARRSHVRISCRATANPNRVGTVITPSASRSAVVVLHENASFFILDSPARGAATAEQLAARGTPSVCVDAPEGTVLVTGSSVLPVRDLLEAQALRFRQLSGKVLITVMHASGEVERTLTDAAHARRAAAAYHDRLYPRPHGAPETAPGVQSFDDLSERGVLPCMIN